MLEQHPWIKYAPDLMIEWEQCRDEGKDVEQYRELCEYISRLPDSEALAYELGQKMIHAPVVEGYAYVEPSDLKEIQNARPKTRQNLSYNLTQEMLEEKLAGAFIGRISGCLLGKPVEGYDIEYLKTLLKASNNYPMNRYIALRELPESFLQQPDLPNGFDSRCWIDKVNGISPQDDDTDYTVLALRILEQNGWDFRPDDVLNAWLSWLPYLAVCTAERVAYRNASAGMLSPMTATYKNPYREWIGAQIRGDFFGYINPGDPEKAAEMAWRDASISHIKNGIYGEMFIAAMIAAAAVSHDMHTVIQAGLGEIPEKCRLREDIDKVLAWFRSGLTAQQVIENIHVCYPSHLWVHTNPNAMIVVMALLYGQNDFGKSICLAVQAAYDTDCNGATVGSIIGMMVGKSNIDSCWTEPYQERLTTSIIGYNQVEVNWLVKKTLEIINKRPEK